MTAYVAAGDVAPLDLVLFNENKVAFGAHVALVMADDELLHLCHEVGRPAVWSWSDFRSRPRYGTFIGAKRVLRLCDDVNADLVTDMNQTE